MRYETTRPVDLMALLALCAATLVAVALLPGASPVRVVLGLVFILVAPGYALVAALFPERHRRVEVRKGEEGEEVEEVSEGLDALERVALSLGLSIAVVPLLGLALNYTPWGIRLVPILAAVTGFVVVAAAVAWWRRARLPERERLLLAVDVDVGGWRDAKPLDKALTVALALAVVAAGGALAYVLATPREGEAFTEFYILGPGGMAEDYPTALAPNETGQVIVGVVNHEGAPVTYRWEAVLVEGTFSGEGANRTFEPTRESLLDANELTLQDEETRETNYTFEAPAVPGTHRLEFRLFKAGDEEPYRRLHLWLDVAGA